MKKRLSLLLILALFSCNEKKSTIEKYEKKAVLNKYTILIPESLEPTDKLNNLASLQFQNRKQDFYVIVLDEPKIDFVRAIDLKVHNSTPDLEGYYKVVLKHFGQDVDIKDFQVSDISKKYINSAKAITFTMTGIYKENNYPIFYRYSIIESKSRFYQIMTWTNSTKAAETVDKMNKIINSFKIEETRSKD